MRHLELEREGEKRMGREGVVSKSEKKSVRWRERGMGKEREML